MQKKSDDCKATALDLLGAASALISRKDRNDLWRIAFGSADLTAADRYTVNRIRVSLRYRLTMRSTT